MKYDNEFTCVNGHTFRANAKLHARCPDCGKLTKRTYTAKVEPASPEVVETGSVPSALPVSTPSNDDGGLKLIRRGKPRSIMAAKKKTPPRVNGRFVSTKKKPTVKKPTVKKPTTQLVTKRTVSAGTKKKPTMPKVTRKPPRTAVARHVQQGGGKKSYADEMIESYGFRR